MSFDNYNIINAASRRGEPLVWVYRTKDQMPMKVEPFLLEASPHDFVKIPSKLLNDAGYPIELEKEEEEPNEPEPVEVPEPVAAVEVEEPGDVADEGDSEVPVGSHEEHDPDPGPDGDDVHDDPVVEVVDPVNANVIVEEPKSDVDKILLDYSKYLRSIKYKEVKELFCSAHPEFGRANKSRDFYMKALLKDKEAELL